MKIFLFDYDFNFRRRNGDSFSNQIMETIESFLKQQKVDIVLLLLLFLPTLAFAAY
jgi:hypothetical protein